MPSEIATTIYRQFGGHRAMAMIGGKVTSMDETTLRIKWAAPAVNGARMLTIRLDPSDTYTLTFYRLGGKTLTVLDDIYADDMRRVFEMHTGLRLSLF